MLLMLTCLRSCLLAGTAHFMLVAPTSCHCCGTSTSVSLPTNKFGLTQVSADWGAPLQICCTDELWSPRHHSSVVAFRRIS